MSFINAVSVNLLGTLSYLIAGLVLLIPLLVIVAVLKLEKPFKGFMKSSPKKIKSITQKIKEGKFTGDLKTSQNVWIEYIPSQYQKELILCAHHDSISMRISMKLMMRAMMIGIGSALIYSIGYFIGFSLLFFLQVNIFQVFWWVFYWLVMIFLVLLNLVFLSRFFRKNESHGSCDDGTGVAIILELAKILKEIQPKVKVTLACFGAEELGLLGSAMFYDERKDSYQRCPVEVISIDMIGEKPPLSIVKAIKPIFSIPTSQNLNEELVQVAEYLEIEVKKGKFFYPGSDFAHWLFNGHEATWVGNSSQVIHSKNDKPDAINLTLVNQCLKLFIGLLLIK
ncbi:MAG: M28 family metallopeptidase [Candidatus Hodarchaeota archaeon]